MTDGMWAILATVVVFGLSNLGVLIWLLSALKTGHDDHERRIVSLETSRDGMVRDVAEMMGREQRERMA